MNNGSKAEKENTPNEANLQEEEVRNGSVPGRGRPGCSSERGSLCLCVCVYARSRSPCVLVCPGQPVPSPGFEKVRLPRGLWFAFPWVPLQSCALQASAHPWEPIIKNMTRRILSPRLSKARG